MLEALLQDAVEPLFTTHSVLPSLAEEDHLRFFFLTGDAVSLETGMCLRLLRGDRFAEGMAGSLADLHAGAAAAWVTMSFAGALAWRAGLSSSQLTGLKGADAGAWLVLGAAGAEDAKRSVVWDLPLDVAAFARQLSACKKGLSSFQLCTVSHQDAEVLGMSISIWTRLKRSSAQELKASYQVQITSGKTEVHDT